MGEELLCIEARGASHIEAARRLERAGWDLDAMEVEAGSPAEKLIDELNEAGGLGDVLERLEKVEGVKSIVMLKGEHVAVLEPGQICGATEEALETAIRDVGGRIHEN